MPRTGFESTIPVFERSKIICALDCAATGTGIMKIYVVFLHLYLKIEAAFASEALVSYKITI